MNAVFADAGYWIALFNPRDQLHNKAVGAAQVTQGRLIVTSQMVLTEFLNHYASFGELFRQRAVQVVRSLQDDANVEVIVQTAEQFEAALTLYAQRFSPFTARLKGHLAPPPSSYKPCT
jgi:predicted nucleic acid-binding protein